jgi:hypothetical protein
MRAINSLLAAAAIGSALLGADLAGGRPCWRQTLLGAGVVNGAEPVKIRVSWIVAPSNAASSAVDIALRAILHEDRNKST